jgi:hypothetical protein
VSSRFGYRRQYILLMKHVLSYYYCSEKHLECTDIAALCTCTCDCVNKNDDATYVQHIMNKENPRRDDRTRYGPRTQVSGTQVRNQYSGVVARARGWPHVTDCSVLDQTTATHSPAASRRYSPSHETCCCGVPPRLRAARHSTEQLHFV